MWTHRQTQIMELVLNNSEGIKGTALAEALKVSARTIRNDITQLNETIRKLGCVISSSTTSGYYLKSEHVPLAVSLLQSAQVRGSGDETADRRYWLAGEILFGGTQDLNDLAEKLFVSPQTIYKDLQRLQKDLVEDTLTISHETVLIRGGEAGARKLFLLLMKDEAVCCRSLEQTKLVNVLGPYYDESELKSWTALVKGKFQEENLILSDNSLFLIVWAVLFSVVRNRLEMRLPAPATYPQTHSKITALLQELVGKECGFQEADIAFLDHFMWTLKLFDTGGDATNAAGRSVFEEFSAEIRRIYGIDFRENAELSEKIAIHIDYMLRRLREGYEMNNPVGSMIREKYTFAYEIAMLIVPIVFRYCGRYLIDGEVSYLAIYVEYYLGAEYRTVKAILVSGFRSSMTELVRLWIVEHFPRRLEIVDVVPHHHLQETLTMVHRKVDLVISLTDMPERCELPVYIIGGLPGQDDLKKIMEMVNKVLVGRRFECASKRHFSQELICIEQEPIEFPAIIRKLSQMLEHAGNIDDAEVFADDVLEREINYPTFLSNSFMIPHPLTSFAKQTSVAVAILKKPVRHQDKNLRLVFLLAIEAKIDPEVNDLFTLFKLISPDKNAFDRLVACETPQNFLEELSAISLAAYRNM